MKTLAERLRYAMEVLPPKRIKGVELAEAVGVKPPSVSDWLSGKSKTMEGENLLRVARYLKVNPVWLATGNGEIQYPNSQHNESLNKDMDWADIKTSSSNQSSQLKELVDLLQKLDKDKRLTNEIVQHLKNTLEILIKIH